MSCKSCGSEINIHFPGLKGVDQPAMLVFPQVVVCLNCGFAEFTVSETELRPLANRAAA
jgi:hypothetical protein